MMISHAIGAIEQQAEASVGVLSTSIVTHERVTLNWTDDLPVAGTTEYRIYRVGAPDVLLQTLSDSVYRQYVVPNLTAATTYQFYVVASDGAGGDVVSNTVTVTTSPALAGIDTFFRNGDEVFAALTKSGSPPVYAGSREFGVAGVAGVGTISFNVEGGRSTSPLTLVTQDIRMRIGPGGTGPIKFTISVDAAVQDFQIEFRGLNSADNCINNMSPTVKSIHTLSNANHLPLITDGGLNSCGNAGVTSGDKFTYSFGDIAASGSVYFEVENLTTDTVVFFTRVYGTA